MYTGSQREYSHVQTFLISITLANILLLLAVLYHGSSSDFLVLQLVINIIYMYLSDTYISMGVIAYKAYSTLREMIQVNFNIVEVLTFTKPFDSNVFSVLVHIASIMIGSIAVLYKKFKTKSEDSLLRLFSGLPISLCQHYRKAAEISTITSIILYTVLQLFPAQYTIPETIIGLLLATPMIPALAYAATSIHTMLLLAINISLGILMPEMILPLFAMIPTRNTSQYLALNKPGTKSVCIGRIKAMLVKSPSIVLKLKQQQDTEWGWQRHLEETIYCLELDTSEGGHTLITGMTGSGKSTLASIIAQSYRNIASVVVIDPHGEYKHKISSSRVLDATQYSINPLELSNTPPSIRAGEIAQLIASLYNLGPLQQRLLEEAIKTSYEAKGIRDEEPASWSIEPPTLDDVRDVLNNLATRDSRAAVLVSYINTLQSSVFKRTTITLHELLQEGSLTVIDLSSLTLHEQKKLYAETLLRLLYGYLQRMGMTERQRLLLVVDEAHMFAPKTVKNSMLSKMYAEMRKYGVNILSITQQALDIDKTIVANSSYVIAFRETEPRERSYVAKILSGSDEKNRIQAVEEILASLPQGHAIVRDRRFNEPLLVSITLETTRLQ